MIRPAKADQRATFEGWTSRSRCPHRVRPRTERHGADTGTSACSTGASAPSTRARQPGYQRLALQQEPRPAAATRARANRSVLVGIRAHREGAAARTAPAGAPARSPVSSTTSRFGVEVSLRPCAASAACSSATGGRPEDDQRARHGVAGGRTGADPRSRPPAGLARPVASRHWRSDSGRPSRSSRRSVGRAVQSASAARHRTAAN